jgi:hypothetical protein
MMDEFFNPITVDECCAAVAALDQRRYSVMCKHQAEYTQKPAGPICGNGYKLYLDRNHTARVCDGRGKHDFTHILSCGSDSIHFPEECVATVDFDDMNPLKGIAEAVKRLDEWTKSGESLPKILVTSPTTPDRSAAVITAYCSVIMNIPVYESFIRMTIDKITPFTDMSMIDYLIVIDQRRLDFHKNADKMVLAGIHVPGYNIKYHCFEHDWR